MHARRTASVSASASVVVRRSGSSLHLYISISIYEAFLNKFSIYFWRNSRGLLRLWRRRARAHASSERGCVTFCNHAVRTGSKVSFLYVTPFSLSFFFYFFLAFLESHFILVDIVRTITQTKLNAEIVRRDFFLSLSYLYLYLLYLYIFICTI